MVVSQENLLNFAPKRHHIINFPPGETVTLQGAVFVGGENKNVTLWRVEDGHRASLPSNEAYGTPTAYAGDWALTVTK